jgi:hypothetical protein
MQRYNSNNEEYYYNNLIIELCSADRPNFDLITPIINSNPRVARRILNDGRTLLHYACIKEAPSDVVFLLLRLNPSATRIRDKYGCYPLLYALKHGLPEDVIMDLIERNKLAASKKDPENGWYPIRYATSNEQYSNVVVERLNQINPRAGQTTDVQNEIHGSNQDVLPQGHPNIDVALDTNQRFELITSMQGLREQVTVRMSL